MQEYEEPRRRMTRGLTVTMAIASGCAAANLYYNQPLLAQIARSYNVPQAQAGILPPLCQIGYATGLFLLVPLGDILERRRLIVTLFAIVTAGLLLCAAAPTLPLLAVASYAVGVSTVMAQLLIPFAVTLSEPGERGRIVGNLMSGLLLGILLSRTVSGFIGPQFGWRTMYLLAAAVMAILAIILRLLLPEGRSHALMTYGALMKSVIRLVREQPVLRWSALSGGLLFGTFSAFWATLDFLLESPAYHLGPELGPRIAGTFGIVGAVGALAASFAGRLADKFSPRAIVGAMTFVTLLAYGIFAGFGYHIAGLILGVIVLDWGVQAGHVANQTRVYALLPNAHSRLNTVYMSSYFVGGSLGSYLAVRGWKAAGWGGVCEVGASFAIAGLLAHTLAGMKKRV